MVDCITNDVSDINLIDVISKVKLVVLTPRNGGLTLMLPVMCAQTIRCFPPLNH